MKILILSYPGSLFSEIRARGLRENGHDVICAGVATRKDESGCEDRHEDDYFEVGPVLFKGGIPARIEIALRLFVLTWKLDIDLLHMIEMNYCYLAPFVRARYRVFENNGSDVLVLPNERSYIRPLYRFCYRFADGVIQDSKHAQAAGIECGATEKHNEVIELGIDLNVYNPNVKKMEARNRLGISRETSMIFCPRGFADVYNTQMILEAAGELKKKHDDFILVFTGRKGVFKSKYGELTEKLGLNDHVILVGYLDKNSELPFYYADSDLVVSVPVSDSLPSTVLEAIACGAQVVVSDLPWFEGRFEKNHDIIVVKNNDFAQLAMTMEKTLKNRVVDDVDTLNDKVKEQFDYRYHGRRLSEFYRRITENKD